MQVSRSHWGNNSRVQSNFNWILLHKWWHRIELLSNKLLPWESFLWRLPFGQKAIKRLRFRVRVCQMWGLVCQLGRNLAWHPKWMLLPPPLLKQIWIIFNKDFTIYPGADKLLCSFLLWRLAEKSGVWFTDLWKDKSKETEEIYPLWGVVATNLCLCLGKPHIMPLKFGCKLQPKQFPENLYKTVRLIKGARRSQVFL